MLKIKDLKKVKSPSWYAVHIGRETGVFGTWAQAEQLVKGYQGAKFKKFDNLDDANDFAMNGPKPKQQQQPINDPIKKPKDEPEVEEEEIPSGVHVFTDGSHAAKTNRSGLGIAFSKPFQSLAVARQLAPGTTNQAAELNAIVSALWIIKNNSELSETQVTVWTDSDYSVKCLMDYVYTWRKNGWLKSDGKPVKHQQLIDKGNDLLVHLKDVVTLRHISEVGLTSHQSLPSRGNLARFVWNGNRIADELATGK